MQAATTAPETIGRYEVVSRLASGGMAEIFLARVRGPGGFRRPVVIKRIFPHLTEELEFRAMFADEARIIAGLRHRNVVHVHELGLEGGELYLVMEYLAGESVSGLLRRLAERKERLPTALALHIAAEVAAGLHAAHELRDAAGEPLHVVHRDVSPQNVIVTYEGEVKVIDFGIAKAADRLARTRTGHVKGKLGYMSPEQCRREEVDRTTDVFALGVVLHELVTGRRLFKGDNDLALARAICDEPIPAPSEVWPDCPEGVDALVMRALSREPLDRFATAAAMRGAAIALARALAPELERGDALRAQMRRLFVDEIADKESIVRATGAGAAVDADTAHEMITRDERPSAAQPSPETAPRRRPWRWPLALASLLLLGLGVWLAIPRSVAEPPARPAPVGVRPEPLPEGPDRPAAEVPAPAPRSLEVRSTPPGANVFVDGEPRGETPMTLRLLGTEPVQLRLEKPGYHPERPSVPATGNALEVTLRRHRGRSPPRTPMAADDPASAMDRDFFYFD